jgi:hypothetical protein
MFLSIIDKKARLAKKGKKKENKREWKRKVKKIIEK